MGSNNSLEWWKFWVSVMAFVISIVSLLISIAVTRKTAKTGIRPILVILYSKEGWIIRNIGSGPALNIIVAQRKGELWFNPVRIPPLAKDGELILRWLDSVNDTSLGANYFDFQTRPYSAFCSNDLSKVFHRLIIPGWEESQIDRYWKDHRYRSQDFGSYPKKRSDPSIDMLLKK